MKKAIVILILGIFLTSTTIFTEVLKMPILIEHFMEHSRNDESMTLWKFLKIHYDHPVKDADYQTDQKLPFVLHTGILTLMFTLNDQIRFKISRIISFFKKAKKRLRNETWPLFALQYSIWQPPKCA